MATQNLLAAAVGAALFGAGIFFGSKILNGQSSEVPASARSAERDNQRQATVAVNSVRTVASRHAPHERSVLSQSQHSTPALFNEKLEGGRKLSPLSETFSKGWTSTNVASWLRSLACSEETVALFTAKEITGEGLLSFIEPDAFGFQPEDKLFWLGMRDRSEIQAVAAELRQLPDATLS